MGCRLLQQQLHLLCHKTSPSHSGALTPGAGLFPQHSVLSRKKFCEKHPGPFYLNVCDWRAEGRSRKCQRGGVSAVPQPLPFCCTASHVGGSRGPGRCVGRFSAARCRFGRANGSSVPLGRFQPRGCGIEKRRGLGNPEVTRYETEMWALGCAAEDVATGTTGVPDSLMTPTPGLGSERMGGRCSELGLTDIFIHSCTMSVIPGGALEVELRIPSQRRPRSSTEICTYVTMIDTRHSTAGVHQRARDQRQGHPFRARAHRGAAE